MRVSLFAVALAAAMTCAPASANTMTFDNLGSFFTDAPDYVEDGIVMRSISGGYYPGPVLHIDSSHVFNNDRFDFRLVSGQAFSLLSLDTIGLPWGTQEGPAHALVTAFDQFGSVLYFADIPTETRVRHTVKFENWTGIHRLQLRSTFEHWDADNLVLTASIPEPATWAMMISGFALVGAAARRARLGDRAHV